MERVSHLVAERERVTARLRELGYDSRAPTRTLCGYPWGSARVSLSQLMSEHALSVRAFGIRGRAREHW